jgi:hypothetical protein
MAKQSKTWMCGRWLAGISGSNPTGGMDISRQYCVLSVTGLCDGLITCPGESYRNLNDEEANAH